MKVRLTGIILACLLLALSAVPATRADTTAATTATVSGTGTAGDIPDEAVMPSLTESIVPSLVRIALSLGVIVAIIYVTVLVLRKLSGNRFGGRRGTAVQIVEQTYIAPKKSICLLRLADRAVLVGVTDTSINLLTEMEWDALPQETAERANRSQTGFPGLLNEAAGKLFGGRKQKGAQREPTA